MEAYDQFRALFEPARFDEALPLAHARRGIVRGRAATATPNCRSPTTISARRNTSSATMPAAETSYRKSLAMLEASQGMSSKRMITPLAGLGAVYAALDQHALAVQQFDRALAVSRRADGLFNLAQLPLIEQARGQPLCARRLRRRRARSLLCAAGSRSRTTATTIHARLPAAMRLATFYESLKQYAAARGLYLRVRDISMKAGGGFSPLADQEPDRHRPHAPAAVHDGAGIAREPAAGPR